MAENVVLKIEAGIGAGKGERLLALVQAASEANGALQSALEALSKALLDGSLEIQCSPDTGKIVKLASLPADTGDDLALAE